MICFVYLCGKDYARLEKLKSMDTVSLNHPRAHKHSKGLSDEQLAARLAQYALLTDADFPNLSDADYANFARSNSGRITKGLEKWLETNKSNGHDKYSHYI